MEAPVTRLYPAPSTVLPLRNLYLAHGLRERSPADRPYVYANFVASLDGRISLEDPALGRRRPPQAITNPRDWRLYLELAAQADAVLTSGRRLRELAASGRDTIRCVAETAEGDLAGWRRARGLPLHPLCLALSTSLRLPAVPLEPPHGEVAILAGSDARDDDARRLQRAGVEVHRARRPRVDGEDIVRFARDRSIRTLYAIGGPEVFHTLLAARLLDRLYLTIAHVALGGHEFDMLVRGDALCPPYGFRLNELYLDPGPPEQLFLTYERDARGGERPD
jgi:riboflavin biosynthesis pyrimidine reductase